MKNENPGFLNSANFEYNTPLKVNARYFILTSSPFCFRFLKTFPRYFGAQDESVVYLQRETTKFVERLHSKRGRFRKEKKHEKEI